MIRDFFKALRGAVKFMLRDLRIRADKRKRAALPDPLKGET